MTSVDRTTCCIAGGGPAGVFLGFLLARQGIEVIVLEKHADFLRDFRGDTIHPSTFRLLDDLGLLEEFLPLTDFRAQKLFVNINGTAFLGPDFSTLDMPTNYIGFVPQWDFLDFLTRHARKCPTFDLRMNAKATGLLREDGRVVGVTYDTLDGPAEIRADLVVGADGRSSTLRAATDLHVEEVGVPIDALWFRMDRPEDDAHTLGWLRGGTLLITIPRRDHWQVAMVVPKDGFDAVKERGLAAFRETVARACPPLGTVVDGIQTWDQVKLLSVQINRLERWHEPGLLFIGDAAHAMSPVGGVGINLAIQDAVAAARLLAGPLRDGRVVEEHLMAVQRRRAPAARRTQRIQRVIHAQIFRGQEPGMVLDPPRVMRWVAALVAPGMRRVAARIIGEGFQPERIE